MEHYLGLPVKKGLFKSPLRADNHATCAFYRNRKGSLIFKDFAGYFHGDCINVVMCIFNCSYYMALQIIANDFHLISRKDIVVNPPKMKYTDSEFKETSSAIIQVEIGEWKQHELNWWLKYGINSSTLKRFKVYPCRSVFLNGKLFHLEQEQQYVFGYFGGIKEEIEQWRIYFPYRRKYKFISNWKSTQIQGASQLPKNGGDLLVITKSLKDVMCLYEFGITAIAPLSENQFVTDSQYLRLKEKFKQIVLLYDNDLPGVVGANKIHKMYPDLNVVIIPRNTGCKDISDYRKTHGYQRTLDLINQAKEYYLK